MEFLVFVIAGAIGAIIATRNQLPLNVLREEIEKLQKRLDALEKERGKQGGWRD